MTFRLVICSIVCFELSKMVATSFPLSIGKINRFQKLEQCKTDDGEPPIVQIVKLVGSGGVNTLSVSGILNFTRDVMPPIKYTNYPTKCSITDNQCVTPDPFVIPDICNFVFVPILSALSAFEPPITKCPFKKNVYELKNLSFDTSLISAQFKENWRFQSRIRITDARDKMAFCLDFDWTMMVASRKSRKTKKHQH